MRELRQIHHRTIEELQTSSMSSAFYLPRRVVQLRQTRSDRRVERLREKYLDRQWSQECYRRLLRQYRAGLIRL